MDSLPNELPGKPSDRLEEYKSDELKWQPCYNKAVTKISYIQLYKKVEVRAMILSPREFTF